MSKPILHIFPDKEQLAKKLAVELITKINAFTSSGNVFYLALSGGSTPIALFRALTGLAPEINWELVRIFWVDERCVPPDHPESNFGVAYQELLKPLNIPESSYFRIRGEDDPKSEALRYGNLIMDVVAPELTFPVFTSIFLGMGDDGHTASVFPDQMELWETEQLCTTALHPQSGQKRVSFTGHLINAARNITFLVTGKSKYEIARKIILEKENYMDYPAALVKPHTGDLHWFLDESAAGDMQTKL